LLQQVLLERPVVTVDALLTQQKVAQALVNEGADYVMVVKDPQPTLREDIATTCADPGLLAGTCTSASTENRSHGRLERGAR
jgi:predicted transposase YbfD/YdcC